MLYEVNTIIEIVYLVQKNITKQDEIIIVDDASEDGVRSVIDGKADVVYGSRFKSGEAARVLYYWHRMGNLVLTWLSNMLTNLNNLRDLETCYKVFRKEILVQFIIEENRYCIKSC